MIPQHKASANPPAQLRAQYEFTCPTCSTEWAAAPSPSMQQGHNHAFVRCTECNTFLRLTIVPDLAGASMAAEAFTTYLDRIQAKPQEELNA